MELIDPVVPYGDREVQEALRLLEEPIIVFGETMSERRQRLRKHMVEKGYGSLDAVRGIQHYSGFTAAAAATPRVGRMISGAVEAGGKLSDAPSELVKKRVALLPVTLERAERRIAKLKEAFVAPTAVRAAHHSMVDRLRGLRLTKSVRNVKVVRQRDGPSTSESASISEFFCMPFTCCAAVPALDHIAVTGAVNGVVTMWSASTCRALGSGSTCETGWGPVRHLAAHPIQPLFFSTTMFDSRIAMWRISTQPLDDTSNAGESGSSVDGANGGTGAVADTNLFLKRVALSSSKHTAGINRIAVDPTGVWLASASDDTTVRLWDINDDTPLLPLVSHNGYEDVCGILDVRFHPDSSLLATADKAGRVVAWDLRSGAVSFTAAGKHGGHLQACTCLSWSLCGFRFATGGADNNVHVWDARYLCRGAAGAPCILAGHDDVVTSVEFCRNPSFPAVPAALVSTSLDGTVRLWDMNATGASVQVLRGPSPVRGQCWPAEGGQTGETLFTVAHSKYWSLWSCVADGESCEVTRRETEDTVASEVVTLLRDDVVTSGFREEEGDGDDEEEEEDEMMALRKHNKTATGESCLAPNNGDECAHESTDDDEDEMQLLKRK